MPSDHSATVNSLLDDVMALLPFDLSAAVEARVLAVIERHMGTMYELGVLAGKSGALESAEELERRKFAPTLAELREDCLRAGYGPDNFVALIKAYRERSGYNLENAIPYVRRLLASGSTDVK